MCIIAKGTNSTPEENPLLIKGEERGEEEEGKVEEEEERRFLLATEILVSSPSILLTTNQSNGNRNGKEHSDWLCSGVPLVLRNWTPSILYKTCDALNPMPIFGHVQCQTSKGSISETVRATGLRLWF